MFKKRVRKSQEKGSKGQRKKQGQKKSLNMTYMNEKNSKEVLHKVLSEHEDLIILMKIKGQCKLGA